MDRRSFLSTSLFAVTAFSGHSAEGAPAKPLRAPAPKSFVFTEARFRSLLGSRFQFVGEQWRGPLELTEVVARTNDERVEQFTTVFRTGAAVRPAPGVYEVEHPAVGRFALRIDGHHESDLRLAAFALLRA